MNAALTAGDATEAISEGQAVCDKAVEARFRCVSLNAILGSLCLGLGLLAWVELRDPPDTVSEPLSISKSSPKGPTSTEPLPEFSLPPLDQFAAVSERPLFSIDRRRAALTDD